MKYTIIAPLEDEKVIFTRAPENKTLGDLFKEHEEAFEAVEINQVFTDDWQSHKIEKTDDIRIYIKDGWIQVIQLIIMIIMMVLSYVLAPDAKKPDKSKSQPALGVAGIQNTLAPGTPKFLVYGRRRVFGHLIASWIGLAEPAARPDHAHAMEFSALYFMGVGPILGITDVKVNGTKIEDIPGPPVATIRLGTEDQTVIPHHEFVHQVYHDGRDMQLVEAPGEGPPDPLIYTTKGNDINEVRLFFSMPQGIWYGGADGLRKNWYELYVKIKLTSSSTWTDYTTIRTIHTKSKRGYFWEVPVVFPEAGGYDIYLQIIQQRGNNNEMSPILLFNVQETKYILTTYPGNSLLEISGIASEQVTSFDSIEGSGLVCGRYVPVPDNGIYTMQYTRNRVWIIRDLLFNQDVALGNRLSSNLWDNAAALEAAAWYDALVDDGASGTEPRDQCDVIINDPRPGWDWIKILLFEGRGCLIPSGGVFKYLIDKDKTPNLLYSSPGNIVEGSLQIEKGKNSKPINTVRAEFPYEENDYKSVPAMLRATGTEDEPERPESVSYTSITRLSQASREMNFFLQKQRQVKKRWVWKSPRTALLSEPLDVDHLAYRTSKHLRGYTGFVHGDSTSSTIATGKDIYLAPGFTYTIHVRTKDEPVEECYVTNTLGVTFSVATLNPSLTFTPETGDIWVIGREDYHIQKVMIDDVEFDGQEFMIKVHHHVPEVYEDVVDPNVIDLENATVVEAVPIPLLGAQVKTAASGGSTHTYYTVVPGFGPLTGSYTTIGTNTILLSSAEPAIDDFFNNAYIEAGSNSSVRIADYAGASRSCTVVDPGFTTLTAGTYSISWSGFLTTTGFTLEGSTSSVLGPWTSIGTITGSSHSTAGTSTYTYFRFGSVSGSGVTSSIYQTAQINTNLDTTVPLAPFVADIQTDEERSGTLDVMLNSPLDRDTYGIITRFCLNSATATTPSVVSFTNISNFRDEENTDTILTSVIEDLSDLSFGASVFARVSCVDFHGNESDSVITFTGSTLSASEIVPPDEVELTDETDLVTWSGSLSPSTIFSETIDGGTVGENNSVEMDVQFLINAITTASSIAFYFGWGGATHTSISANVSDGATAIDADTPYWINFLIEPNGSSQNQTITATKYGDEVPANSYEQSIVGCTVNSDITQTMTITVQITGSTYTSILRQHAYVKQIEG